MNVTEADASDDEAWIEAEIQRQLDALTVQDADVDVKEEQGDDYEKPAEDESSEEDDIPDSVTQYLQKVQHRSEDVEKELQECDDLLKKTDTDKIGTDEDDEFYYESAELKELAFQLGEDPEELRDRVMSELQKDELLDAEEAEREKAASRIEEEENDNEKRQEEGQDPYTGYNEDNMVIALVSESNIFEQAARAKVRELEGRQSQMDHMRYEDRERELQEQAKRDRKLEEGRIQRQKELDVEQQRLMQERMVTQAKADAELAKEFKQQEESLKKYQAEIEEFSQKMQEEKEQVERQLKEENEKKKKQVYEAAVTIQSAYRSYRTRKPYLKKLHHLREEREERKVQQRQMEIAEQRKQAEMKKKKERTQKRKKEEAERKEQEEHQRKLEEERKEQERKEQERKEKEQREKERLEAERLEAERQEKERKEQEKLEMEQKTQDILAKIAAENKSVKQASRTPAEDSVIIEPGNTSNNHIKSAQDAGHLNAPNKGHDSEPSSGDLVAKVSEPLLRDNRSRDDKEENLLKGKTPVGGVQLQTESNRLDHPTFNEAPSENSVNSLEKSAFKSNLNQNQVNGGGSNPISKPKLDKNDNFHGGTSERINQSGRYLSETTHDTSHDNISQEIIQAEDEKTQSKNVLDRITRTQNTKDIHQNHIGNTNYHASTTGVAIDRVVNVSNVSNENAIPDPGRAPSSDDSIAPSSDDLYVISGDPLQSLPEEAEKLRLQWMTDCTSLSKLLSDAKQRGAKQRRHLRRPRSAKKLPDLMEEQIMAGSLEKDALEKVTTVHLEDLPGFNLSTLKKCPRLQCLTVHRCGLTAVEGLENSPNVVTVNVQHNAVESVNCRDHSQLCILQLAHNHLTSLQGLEGCPNLRWLEVQHNKLARISGLESVSSLTHLYASHNQLINTTGLEALVCLQRLDLSHNHLSSVSGIDKCCLLRRLNLSRNSLTQVPDLTNHTLLRELYLDDNSMSDLDILSDAWLPMLTTLSVSQNSLPKIPALHGCKLLKKLDVSHNFIADIDCVVPGLEILKRLEQLSVTGNPVTEEQNCRSTVLSAAPNLKDLDGDVLSSNQEDKKAALSQFEAMCLSQMLAQDDLQNTQQTEIQELLETHPEDVLQLSQLRSKHMEDAYKQAVEHRYMHEYGDMTIIARQPSKTRSKGNARSKNNVGSQDIVASKAVPSSVELNSVDRDSAAGVIPHGVIISDSQQLDKAATFIQALWRGYAVRRDITQHTTLWLSAVIIQTAWRAYIARRDASGFDIEGKLQREGTPRRWGTYEIVAATKIQATWRGHSVRKRLRHARRTIKFDDEDDMFGEIDLTSFEFNEESIEQGWLPAATPVIPSSHPVLPPAAPLHHSGPHKPSPPTGDRPLTRQPRQAWRNADSPLLDNNKGLLGKPPLPPTSQYQDPRQSIGRLDLGPTSPSERSESIYDDRSQQSTPFGKPPIPPSPSTGLDTPRSNRSNKTEKLTEEWGFKDTYTAELMMKRAKKLNKGNANKKKKMLDPIKRYQMMKKAQEASTPRVTQPSKKGVQRKDYFKAREEEQEHAFREKVEEEHARKDRTFEWVHHQVGDFEVSDSRINPRGMSGRQSTSEPNLPHISPDLLHGGRVQLMASPTMELQSVDGASSVASVTNRNRSNSFSSAEVQLPPIKTNSAPSSHYRERVVAKQPAAKNAHVAWGKTPRSGGNSYR